MQKDERVAGPRTFQVALTSCSYQQPISLQLLFMVGLLRLPLTVAIGSQAAHVTARCFVNATRSEFGGTRRYRGAEGRVPWPTFSVCRRCQFLHALDFSGANCCSLCGLNEGLG